ncbi:MAG: hypothetical protein NTV68_13170 [Methanomicrobiales archaeon]|nr:hypothetical protein [Methanomicrobiales archaeon]
MNWNLHSVQNETARPFSRQMTRKPNNECREKLVRYHICNVGNSTLWPPVECCRGRMPVYRGLRDKDSALKVLLSLEKEFNKYISLQMPPDDGALL